MYSKIKMPELRKIKEITKSLKKSYSLKNFKLLSSKMHKIKRLICKKRKNKIENFWVSVIRSPPFVNISLKEDFKIKEIKRGKRPVKNTHRYKIKGNKRVFKKFLFL